MIGAVIFDVDGTLVDSVHLHARAWQDAFAKFGHDISYDDIRSQIGKGGDQLMPVFLSAEEIYQHGEEIEEYRSALFKERYLSKVRGFSGVRELVQLIRNSGRRVALASSAKADELKTYKKIARIDDLVDEETTADDAKRSKPHPDIFASAMHRLDEPRPDQVVVVGDSPYDAQAAAKIGLRTIGVLSGGFPEEDLRRAGCIAIYRDPQDLLKGVEAYLRANTSSKPRRKKTLALGAVAATAVAGLLIFGFRRRPGGFAELLRR